MPALVAVVTVACLAGPILAVAWFALLQERVQQRRLTRIAAATWLREGGDPRVVRAWRRAGRPSAYDLGRWTAAGLSERHVLQWQVAGWSGRRWRWSRAR